MFNQYGLEMITISKIEVSWLMMINLDNNARHCQADITIVYVLRIMITLQFLPILTSIQYLTCDHNYIIIMFYYLLIGSYKDNFI